MKKLTLNRLGLEVLLDEVDYEYLQEFKWYPKIYATGHVYAYKSAWYFRGFTHHFYMHKIITDTIHSGFDFHVDHINGNTLDNRRENLRVCSASQNIMNSRTRSNNKSGVRGVSFSAHHNGWMGQITRKDVGHIIQHFDTFEEAVEWRRAKELELFGKFRREA